MDLLIAQYSVPLAQADTLPQSGTPQYATAGNAAAGIPPTLGPAYHYNMMMAELVNAVKAAGLGTSGSDWTQLAQAIAIVGHRVAVFGANGVFTVPNGCYVLTVQLVGGGGAGGGCNGNNFSGAGGGAGGFAQGMFPVVPGNQFQALVPPGVPGATNGGQGGGNVSFGSLLSATGGGGGQGSGASNAAGGAPGNGTGPYLNLIGGYGNDGNAGSSMIGSGSGGASYFGGGGRAGSGGGAAGGAPGSGGGGAYGAVSGLGGAGAPGLVIVTY